MQKLFLFLNGHTEKKKKSLRIAARRRILPQLYRPIIHNATTAQGLVNGRRGQKPLFIDSKPTVSRSLSRRSALLALGNYETKHLIQGGRRDRHTMHLGLQKIAACTVGALLFLFFAVGAKAEDGKPWPSVQSNPLVIELYTSQGCSSCPPADLMLDQLSDIPGVLGLAFQIGRAHV